MPDIASLANTIAGTKAQVPKMDFGGVGSGGGGSNRGLIQENVNPGEAAGKAVGALAAVFFGKKLQDREKEVQAGIKLTTDVFEIHGGTFANKASLKKYIVKGMKVPDDSADIVIENLLSTNPPDPNTGLITIKPKAQQEAFAQTTGTAQATEQQEVINAPAQTARKIDTAVKIKQAEFGLEKEQQPKRLEWAKQEETAKQDIAFDRGKKLAYLQDDIQKLQEQRKVTIDIAEENRKRETQEGKLALENAKEELEYRKISGKKMRKEIQLMENTALQQSQEDFYKTMDAINKYTENNFPTLIDSKTKQIKPVKEGSQEQLVIDKIFSTFGKTAQFNVVKDKTWALGDDYVAPFILTPQGALLEASKVPKSEPIKLTPEQEKDYQEKLKKDPNLTREEHLQAIGIIKKSKPATGPVVKKETKPKETIRQKYNKTMKTIDDIMMMPKVNQ